MRFLVRLADSSVQGDSLLATVKALARSVGVEARNPKWTSYGALEMDIFCPARADFDLFISAVSPLAKQEFVTDLNHAPLHKPEEELLSEARDYFNAERYWECHETLEGIWRQKHGDEKRLLQGIILVCAAFVHHQKGEDAVALGILRRAAKQLEFPLPVYGGFRVGLLKNQVAAMLAENRLKIFRV